MITSVVSNVLYMGCRPESASAGIVNDPQWQWAKVRHYVLVMVKTLLLGLILASVFCIIVNSTPVIHQIGSKHHHHDHQFHHQPQHHQQQGPQHNSTTTHTSAGSSASSGSDPGGGGAPFDDPGARSERSANLSHVTGASRKIKMYIKNRDLQLLPDGTVNGTTDDNSAYCEFHSHSFLLFSFISSPRNV